MRGGEAGCKELWAPAGCEGRRFACMAWRRRRFSSGGGRGWAGLRQVRPQKVAVLVEVFDDAAGYALLVLGVGIMDDKLPARGLMPEFPYVLVLKHFETVLGCLPAWRQERLGSLPFITRTCACSSTRPASARHLERLEISCHNPVQPGELRSEMFDQLFGLTLDPVWLEFAPIQSHGAAVDIPLCPWVPCSLCGDNARIGVVIAASAFAAASRSWGDGALAGMSRLNGDSIGAGGSTCFGPNPVKRPPPSLNMGWNQLQKIPPKASPETTIPSNCSPRT